VLLIVVERKGPAWGIQPQLLGVHVPVNETREPNTVAERGCAGDPRR
jgi:hypothetical protein